MKRRHPEAARLEADYLGRLAALLAGRPADEASRLYFDVKDRIETGLASLPGDTIPLSGMATVLERLGPPETQVACPETQGAPDRNAGPPPVPPPAPEPDVPPLPAPASAGPDIAMEAPGDRHGQGLVALVTRYFEGTRRYSRTRFILEMALLSIPLKMIMGVLWAVVGGRAEPSTTEVLDRQLGGFQLFVNACVFAPLLETLVGQWLPLWIASRFTRETAWRVAFSAVLFSALHLYVGFSGFLSILPVGVLLAWSFTLKREQSRREAYGVTCAVHALHNFVTLFIYYAVT
jgi:hypothetical protein